jgi:hypothetical protein
VRLVERQLVAKGWGRSRGLLGTFPLRLMLVKRGDSHEAG